VFVISQGETKARRLPTPSETQTKKSKREVPIDRYSSEKRERREEKRRHSLSFARRVAILGERDLREKETEEAKNARDVFIPRIGRRSEC